MERYTLSEPNAFALLQQAAQHRSVSVQLAARELVASAEVAGSYKQPGAECRKYLPQPERRDLLLVE